ncbi:MAG: DUF350 domain-containing protein [Gemmataceae bacterium]|nr:DUF350 domain-containing protein [Gemmataceae bacterium]
MLALLSVFAATTTAPTLPPDAAWNWDMLVWHLAQVTIYVLFGLGLFAIAYLVIDKATPFSIGKEIQEKQNIAMGVVLGSIFIGIALILAAAIRG